MIAERNLIPAFVAHHPVILTGADPSLADFAGHHISIGALTRSDAVAWLTDTLQLRAKIASRLASRLDRIPLVVDQTIATIRNGICEPDEYLAAPEHARPPLRSIANTALIDSVRSRLGQIGSSTAMVLEYLAVGRIEVIDTDFTVELLTPVLKTPLLTAGRRIRAHLAELVRLGLIQAGKTTAFHLHKSIADAVVALMPTSRRQQRLDTLAVRCAQRLDCDEDRKSSAEAALGVLVNASYHDVISATLVELRSHLFQQLHHAGDVRAAAWLAHEAPAANWFGPWPDQYASVMGRLDDATALHDGGKHRDALAVLDTLGALANPDIVIRSNSIRASILNTLHDFAGSQQALNSAAELMDQTDLARASNNDLAIDLAIDLARVLRNSGNPRGAVRHACRAIRQLSLDPSDSRRYLRALAYLGLALGDMHLAEQATAIHQKAARAATRAYGQDHYWYANAVNNEALAQMQAGHADEAIVKFSRALPLFARLYGRDYFDTGIVANNLARALRDRGRPEQALTYHDWALRTTRDNPGQAAFVQLERSATLIALALLIQ